MRCKAAPPFLAISSAHSLNPSAEWLNEALCAIEKNLVKKCLDMVFEIAEKKDDCKKFSECLFDVSHLSKLSKIVLNVDLSNEYHQVLDLKNINRFILSLHKSQHQT